MNTINAQLPKRIQQIDETIGLEADYGGGSYTATVGREWDGTFHIAYYRSNTDIAHKTEAIEPENIEAKMRSIQPDLRRWRKINFADYAY